MWKMNFLISNTRFLKIMNKSCQLNYYFHKKDKGLDDKGIKLTASPIL